MTRKRQVVEENLNEEHESKQDTWMVKRMRKDEDESKGCQGEAGAHVAGGRSKICPVPRGGESVSLCL